MTIDMNNFKPNRWTRTHPRNVYTVGSTEPILSILDVRGFDLYDLFLVGINDSCGGIHFPTESRAREAASLLEPAYATRVHTDGKPGEMWWIVDYDRRALDGTKLSSFITDLTLKDGRQVIKDGRWVN
jgi:hypothetical protein